MLTIWQKLKGFGNKLRVGLIIAEEVVNCIDKIAERCSNIGSGGNSSGNGGRDIPPVEKKA